MSNPILTSNFNEKPFQEYSVPMTVNGTVSKLMFLSFLMLCSGGATWYNFALGNLDKVSLLTTGGIIIGFILSLIIVFAKKSAPFLVPLYAFAEGAALAGISCFFESSFPGIVVKAVSLTFLTLFSMLFLYIGKIIQPSEKLRSVITTATTAIALFYLVNIVLSFFHISIPMMSVTDSSLLSIGVSLIITIIAAFNLIIDFEFIEVGSKNYFPKEYEWIGAFGILITLVWLYLEILRLLAKMQNRR